MTLSLHPFPVSVMPEGLKALEAASQRFGFKLQFEHFDFASCDYYETHGRMLPDDWVQVLKPFDAIFFGAVGDPARVPDHISLWGSLLQFRRQFDLYVNLRPCRLVPGVPCPLSDPGKIDFWIVRENTEGRYSTRSVSFTRLTFESFYRVSRLRRVLQDWRSHF